jgi:hypothetical protein
MASSADWRVDMQRRAMATVRTTASLALLLALASSSAASAASLRPVPLGFAPPATRAPGADAVSLPRELRPAQTFRVAPPREPIAVTTTRQLRRGALQSVVDAPEPSLGETRGSGEGRLQLHFQRGGGVRDLQTGYSDMCNRVSAKIWDDPNGKRVRFDVAGKPGFGIEIPLGRASR